MSIEKIKKLLPWHKVSFLVVIVGLIFYVFYPLVFNASQKETIPQELTQSTDAPFDISQSFDSIRLTSQLNILEDKTATLTIDNLVSTDQNALFKSAGEELNFGFNESVFWVKFQIVNNSNTLETVFLRQDYPLIDHLSFWQVQDKKIVKTIKTGDRENFGSREIKHRDFLFSIKSPANSTQDIYLRYQSEGSINIGLTLNANTHLLTQFSDEQLAFGAYYGGVLVLAIYNIFLFFAAKEKAFTHYIWYLLSYGLYMSTHNGYAFQFLWPENPWLANQSLLLLLGLTLYWGMKFSQEILASVIYAPKLNHISNWIQYSAIVSIISSFVLPYELMVQLLSILTVIVCSAIMALGCISLSAGYKPAIFFMIAWSTLLVAVLIYMLKTFGLLPHNAFTQNAFQIASLIEMTLLSVALAHHFSELKKKSYTDALTFLFNRRHFDDKFEEEFSQARADNKELSLLVMDIDHFKKFNDAYGHAEGDKVIQFVASVLKNGVRKPLIPCRYGGEEFAIILPRTSKESAMILAQRLRETVATESDKERPITISVGVANINDIDQQGRPLESQHRLFEAADEALYQAKENGRNRVEGYRAVNDTFDGLVTETE